jgi:hypothetical protein
MRGFFWQMECVVAVRRRKKEFRIHQMIILPALRYGDAAYRLASPTTLKTLDPVHHKEGRLALRTFAVCRAENVLQEAEIFTFTEIRRIEATPYYLRPPWRKNRYEQIDQSLCAIPKG